MIENPYDPRKRTDLTQNEKRSIRFMGVCLQGDNVSLIDEYVAANYIQYTYKLQSTRGVKEFSLPAGGQLLIKAIFSGAALGHDTGMLTLEPLENSCRSTMEPYPVIRKIGP
jgi:hypothetical protein